MSMIVQRFLFWVKTASEAERVLAARALGRSYVLDVMTGEDKRLAEVAMTSLLDDPSLAVRRALAEAVAASPEVPQHIIVGLCDDDMEVAGPVLSLSPVLTVSELVDYAASHDGAIQAAVAARAPLPAPVAAALAEVASAEACAVLVRNHDAVLTHSALVKLVERFAADGDVREGLLARSGLPVAIQQLLVRAVADSLASLVSGRSWMSKERANAVAGEACEKATAQLTVEFAGRADMPDLVRHLRQSGQLTPGLLLRSMAMGNAAFFEAALSDLAGLPPERIRRVLADRHGSGFEALYRRVGLPAAARSAFRAALDVLDQGRLRGIKPDDPKFQRILLDHMIACASRDSLSAFDPILSLLKSIATDVEREHARGIAESHADVLKLSAA